jgi:hypothetical protein
MANPQLLIVRPLSAISTGGFQQFIELCDPGFDGFELALLNGEVFGGCHGDDLVGNLIGNSGVEFGVYGNSV